MCGSLRSSRCCSASTLLERKGARTLLAITRGFVYLAVFSMAQLFAAVGLWIRASWGAVLLVAATVLELGMYLLGSKDVQMSALGFAIRLVLLVSIVVVFVLSIRMRERAHD